MLKSEGPGLFIKSNAQEQARSHSLPDRPVEEECKPPRKGILLLIKSVNFHERRAQPAASAHNDNSPTRSSSFPSSSLGMPLSRKLCFQSLLDPADLPKGRQLFPNRASGTRAFPSQSLGTREQSLAWDRRRVNSNRKPRPMPRRLCCSYHGRWRCNSRA